MTEAEMLLFDELLSSHRELWMTFQTYRYLQEHPEMNWEVAHNIFLDQSHEVYNSLAEALRDEQPLRDKLRTVLLQSRLTEAEVRDRMKNERIQ